jgi:hypothetical protein
LLGSQPLVANAVAFVFRTRQVIDVFRNPLDPATQLRNAGPLETPAGPARGKISCLAQRVTIPGAALPVR